MKTIFKKKTFFEGEFYLRGFFTQYMPATKTLSLYYNINWFYFKTEKNLFFYKYQEFYE